MQLLRTMTRGRTRRASRRRAPVLAATLAIGALLASPAGPADAGTVIPSIPGIDAVDTTPRVVDDSVVPDAGVRELRQVNNTMFAGGSFHSVQNAARTKSYTRQNLFSFDATTGAVFSWAPAPNGAVYTIEPSANGRYIYIGGDFNTFDGQSANRLVKYDLTLRQVVTTFRFPVATGRVSDIQLVNGRLVVAGNFPGGIVAVNPDTGGLTSYFDQAKATGQEPGYTTRVYRFAVNPTSTRMVVIGSFSAVGGQPRQQAAMIVLGSTSASVSGWSSARWNEDCSESAHWYTRDVDWTPDGTGFVIVTTGAGFPGTERLCDTATRWRATDQANQPPLWVNYSGGDTFHSVAATDKAIFVAGHIRWLDNPEGRDSKGPGAVDRLGIGAIDPVTGKATSWNPTKSTEGGNGAYDLYFTNRGLWVAHFERYLGTGPSGRELHEGLGLLPFP